MEKTPEEIAAQEKAAQEAAAAQADADAKKAQEAGAVSTNSLTLEQALAEIEKQKSINSAVRKENAETRIKLTNFEQEQKKKAEAEMSEVEKANARIKELEAQNQQSLLQAQNGRVLAKAAAMGFNDPADAVMLFDRASLSEDEKNLEQLLKDVLKAKPYLAKSGSGLPGVGGGGNPGGALETAVEAEKVKKVQGLFPALGRLRNGRI